MSGNDVARIRTIKPEFPQSESVGKLSRDARLLFIQIWTIVDDSGRARAASRMLASLLYPYDDDAKDLMEGWLAELDAGDHIRRYDVDGSQYLEVVKWLEHQKIDKPSKSRLPEFAEASRIVAKPREASTTDLVPSTLDLGPSTLARAAPSQDSAPARRNHRPKPIPWPKDFPFTDAHRLYAESHGFGVDEARDILSNCENYYLREGKPVVDCNSAFQSFVVNAKIKKREAEKSSGSTRTGNEYRII
jgi:hypothetical protein